MQVLKKTDMQSDSAIGVAWQIFTNISKKLADLIFRAENVRIGFL
jgi:hypothetical protein